MPSSHRASRQTVQPPSAQPHAETSIKYCQAGTRPRVTGGPTSCPPSQAPPAAQTATARKVPPIPQRRKPEPGLIPSLLPHLSKCIQLMQTSHYAITSSAYQQTISSQTPFELHWQVIRIH